MATPACVDVVRVEHRRPSLVPQQLAVPSRRARVDDVRRMNGAPEGRAAGENPRREHAARACIEQVPMRIRVEHAQDGGSCVAGANGGGLVGADTSNHFEEARDSPPRGRRVSFVTRRAGAREDRRHVCVVDRGRRVAAPFLGTRREQQRGRDRVGDRRPRRCRSASLAH